MKMHAVDSLFDPHPLKGVIGGQNFSRLAVDFRMPICTVRVGHDHQPRTVAVHFQLQIVGRSRNQFHLAVIALKLIRGDILRVAAIEHRALQEIAAPWTGSRPPMSPLLRRTLAPTPRTYIAAAPRDSRTRTAAPTAIRPLRMPASRADGLRLARLTSCARNCGGQQFQSRIIQRNWRKNETHIRQRQQIEIVRIAKRQRNIERFFGSTSTDKPCFPNPRICGSSKRRWPSLRPAPATRTLCSGANTAPGSRRRFPSHRPRRNRGQTSSGLNL